MTCVSCCQCGNAIEDDTALCHECCVALNGDEQDAEIKRLASSLPMTRDGVRYVPGMPLYQARRKPCCGTVAITRYEGGHTVEVDGNARRFGHDDGWLVQVEECFSTLEAAVEAAERSEG